MYVVTGELQGGLCARTDDGGAEFEVHGTWLILVGVGDTHGLVVVRIALVTFEHGGFCCSVAGLIDELW